MIRTGRWSRSEPEIQQIWARRKPVRPLPAADFSAIEARILVSQFRERFPEIAELVRDLLRPVRENPGLLITQHSGGNRALRRAADKRKK
jgi:hypothetical protein